MTEPLTSELGQLSDASEFDSFLDMLIEENPDVPFNEGDLELFSSLMPEYEGGQTTATGTAQSCESGHGLQNGADVTFSMQAPYDTTITPESRSITEHYATLSTAPEMPTFQQRDDAGFGSGDDLRNSRSAFATTSQPRDIDVLGGVSSHKRLLKSRKPPSAASLAQKKYMERQKLKMAHADRQVVELTRSLEVLMREKAELEVKERIMRNSLDGITVHMDHLFADKVVREFQQLGLLQKKAELQSRVEGREIPLEEAKTWSMKDFICLHFEKYLQRLRDLLLEAKASPDSDAAREVYQLVTMHGEFDRPGAVASCFHWTVLCWNLEESEKCSTPSPADWASILVELGLTAEQESQLLAARQILLRKMEDIVQRRREIYSRLGLEMLSGPKEQMHKCPAAMDLYNNLRQEQTACLGFILNADAALTSLQEAILDVKSAPWCPEILKLTDILARQRGEALPTTSARFPSLRPAADLLVMPFATPFEVSLVDGALFTVLPTCQPGAVGALEPAECVLRSRLAQDDQLAVACGGAENGTALPESNRGLTASELQEQAHGLIERGKQAGLSADLRLAYISVAY